VTVAVTVVGAVTSEASVGLVILTWGAGPITGPRILKLLDVEACSEPVAAVIARGPNVALEEIVIWAEKEVALFTVTVPKPPEGPPFTEMPGPKLTWVVP
jgi:hypothetical protein